MYVLLLQKCLAILGHLQSHMNLKVSLSISFFFKVAIIFIGVELNLQINFETNDVLAMLSCPTYGYGIALHWD